MAEADENLEIYDFNDEDPLGDIPLGKLDESLDAFNDDTFAIGGAGGPNEIGRTSILAGIQLPTRALVNRSLHRNYRILLAANWLVSQVVNRGSKVSRPPSAFHSMRIPCWAQ